jgi:hypothetical protein
LYLVRKRFESGLAFRRKSSQNDQGLNFFVDLARFHEQFEPSEGLIYTAEGGKSSATSYS